MLWKITILIGQPTINAPLSTARLLYQRVPSWGYQTQSPCRTPPVKNWSNFNWNFQQFFTRVTTINSKADEEPNYPHQTWLPGKSPNYLNVGLNGKNHQIKWDIFQQAMFNFLITGRYLSLTLALPFF